MMDGKTKMHDRNFIWTTEKGKTWKLKDMTTSHLINTLWHMKKRRDKFKAQGTHSIGLYNGCDTTLQLFKDEIAYRITILGDALTDLAVEEHLTDEDDEDD